MFVLYPKPHYQFTLERCSQFPELFKFLTTSPKEIVKNNAWLRIDKKYEFQLNRRTSFFESSSLQVNTLSICCALGYIDHVKCLLERYKITKEKYVEMADVSKALFCAAQNGHDDIFKLIFDKTIDLPCSYPVNRARYCIAKAAASGRVKLLEYVLAKLPDDIQDQAIYDSGQYSILYCAVDGGHAESLLLLLSKLTPEQHMQAIRADKFHLIAVAVARGYLDIVNILLSKISKQEYSTALRTENYLAFRYLVKDSHAEVLSRVIKLLPLKDRQRLVSQNNFELIRMAIENEREDILETLITSIGGIKLGNAIFVSMGREYCKGFRRAFGLSGIGKKLRLSNERDLENFNYLKTIIKDAKNSFLSDPKVNPFYQSCYQLLPDQLLCHLNKFLDSRDSLLQAQFNNILLEVAKKKLDGYWMTSHGGNFEIKLRCKEFECELNSRIDELRHFIARVNSQQPVIATNQNQAFLFKLNDYCTLLQRLTSRDPVNPNYQGMLKVIEKLYQAILDEQMVSFDDSEMKLIGRSSMVRLYEQYHQPRLRVLAQQQFALDKAKFSSQFFNEAESEMIINQRHQSAERQQAYDNRFALQPVN